MKNSHIIAIIYDGETNLPHSVFTREPGHYGQGTHDFSHCPMDGVLAHHHSGGGGQPYVNRATIGSMKIWVKPGTRVFEDCSRHRPRRPRRRHEWSPAKPLKARKLRRWGYVVLKNPIQYCDPFNTMDWNPFDHPDAVETEAVYCSVCHCFRVDDGDPCEHLNWCDDCGEHRGPGADVPTCKHCTP